MAGRCYVFSYVNPDTDGVCSAIGYSRFKRSTSGEGFLPVVFGTLNNETAFALEHFGVETPVMNPVLPQDCAIALVDTHHVRQLPAHMPLANVVEILDHHPAGDPAAFPNAAIQNDRIGAVATLVAERFKACPLEPDSTTAGLLLAAIISNTLNFSAPSTTDRDKEACAWLQKIAPADPDFACRMFESRSGIDSLSTQELLLADYKEFSLGGFVVGISQIESMDFQKISERADLMSSLERIKAHRRIDHVFLNCIDILKKKALLVCCDPVTQEKLTRALGADFKNNRAYFDHIVLRKTDLLPQLKKVLF
ncbi:MAG: DHH family phosphoesterase [Deltaproteobacteria bacterium]|nr:DHH family phosphoesterase [Deltaproteobacteria bacterium]